VSGFFQHFTMSLRLHRRNRMALVYGYLFPLIFLGAFWVLYRHESVPLLQHMGELLTVSVLGGACFGLPTTLVSERERGVWRRYRLLPAGTWSVVLSTVLARYVLLLTAGLLQLGVALAVGMTLPAHPLDLLVAFTFVAGAFIGLGLVIAMLADNVPAVQALGQCIFLPMLIIGGVAVPLASLPPWAQHVAAFFPGRYAVEALQACVTGPGWSGVRFDLAALAVIGVAGAIAGAKLFRWESGQRFAAVGGKPWLAAALAGWALVGAAAEWRGHVAPVAVEADRARLAAPAQQPWETVTDDDVARLDFANLPPDYGVVAPIAGPDEKPSEDMDRQLGQIESRLATWPAGRVADLRQRTLNLLCLAALPDLVQNPVERWMPGIVFDRLELSMPRRQLVQILTWIALHPEEGQVLVDLSAVGIHGVGTEAGVRERVRWYAIKFVARLTGRVEP